MERGKKKDSEVTVVRSGPDLTKLKVGAAKPELKKGFQYMVAYIGVMGQQEGLDLLLKSIEYIVKDQNRTDFYFCLMGNGPVRENLMQMSVELNLEAYVEFPGRVSNEYLADVLNTADLCVNPDIPSEMNDKSTMNKIMEYMAFAKPIVQYSLKEGSFSAGKSSLYAKNTDTIDFANKIIWLVEHPEEAKKMGEWGRERVEKELSWDFEKPKLISAYKKLLKL